jgi:regulator of protease activity HflC (stomatin/prohibitin superfamily)
MAEITRYPFLSHFRAEPSQHILRYRSGRLVGNGRGLAFWFRRLNTAVAVVPADDMETQFLFSGRSRDYQEVHVQGVVTLRVADPVRLAERVDFSVDLVTGGHRHKPLEKIAGAVTELAQQLANNHLASAELQRLLGSGGEEIRQRIEEGLHADAGLSEMGLSPVAVRVSSVSPEAEVEKALRVPMREAIQQSADEATFRRRAEAVQKERAIQENELQTKIELSKREEMLIEQKGNNDRRRVTDESEAARIATDAEAARSEVQARARATGIKAVEEAKVSAGTGPDVDLPGVSSGAADGAGGAGTGGKLTAIGQVTVTPDHVASLLKQLGMGGAAAAGVSKREV